MGVGVEDEKAAYAVGVTHCPAQADRTAPVLGHDRHVAQVKRLKQRLEPVGVPRDPVQIRVVGLFGAAEAEVVGHDRAVPGVGERTDEVAVQIPPGRVTVQQHHRAPIARTHIDIVHPAVGGVEPARLVRPAPTKGPVDLHHPRTLRNQPPYRLLRAIDACDSRGTGRRCHKLDLL